MGVTAATIAGISINHLYARPVNSHDNHKIQSAIKGQITKNLQSEGLTKGGFADMKDVIATGGTCAPIANQLSNQYHDKIRNAHQDADDYIDMINLQHENFSVSQLAQLAKNRVNFYMENIVEDSGSNQVVNKEEVHRHLEHIRQKSQQLEICLDKNKLTS